MKGAKDKNGYSELKIQAKRHFNTLDKKERYSFDFNKLEDVHPYYVGSEEVFYMLDGIKAGLAGDIESIEDRNVENASKFLEHELEDFEHDWGYSLESEEKGYGIVMSYKPQNTFSSHQNIYFHVFAPDNIDMVDLYIERRDKGKSL